MSAGRPAGRRYYQPTDQGLEKRVKERLEQIIEWKKEIVIFFHQSGQLRKIFNGSGIEKMLDFLHLLQFVVRIVEQAQERCRTSCR